MLPLKAVITSVRSNRYMSKNDIEFRLYRKFGTETTIRFEPEALPDDKIKEKPPEPKKPYIRSTGSFANWCCHDAKSRRWRLATRRVPALPRQLRMRSTISLTFFERGASNSPSSTVRALNWRLASRRRHDSNAFTSLAATVA